MDEPKKILISVIVPVYNVENYLDRCLESLLRQSYQQIEVILVDDGSTDGSGILCDKWASLDERISAYHKKNGGLSDARNYGIKKAKGAYLGFVDSDDTVEPAMYQRLLQAALIEEADISMCRIRRHENGRSFLSKDFSFDKNVAIFSGKTAVQELLRMRLDESSCNKIFKRELFDEVTYPVGATNEDFAVLYRLFLNAKRIAYIPEPFYQYFKREGSITTQSFSEKQFDKYWNAMEMLRFIEAKANELGRDAQVYCWNQTFRLIKEVYMQQLQSHYAGQCRCMRKTLIESFWSIIQEKSISSKEKGMLLAAAIVPKIYVGQYTARHGVWKKR